MKAHVMIATLSLFLYLFSFYFSLIAESC